MDDGLGGENRGFLSAGVHVPRYRLRTETQRSAFEHVNAPGIEATTVPAADEDTLTMAVAAAERALAVAPIGRDEVTTATLATTTPPQPEGARAGRLSMMLGLDRDVATASFEGDLLAGAAALDRAFDADGPAIVAIADAPPGDPAGVGQRLGAAAAAFLIDDGAEVPVLGRGWVADDRPGVRYRPVDGGLGAVGVRGYERAAVRDGVVAAVDGMTASLEDGFDREDLAAAALHQPDGRTPGRLADALELAGETADRGLIADRVGDVGTAGVPLGIAVALDGRREGDRTLAAFAGSEGSGAAFLFAGGLDVAGLDDLDDSVEVDVPTALRLRGHLGDATVPGGGAHVSLPTWRSTLASRYRLQAGRCPDCAAVAFPPEGACHDCGALVEYEPLELNREGTVRAVTVIDEGGAPPEFAELQRRGGPFATAIIECPAPGGGAARLPGMLTDCEPASVTVGDPVRATVRRLYEQAGVLRYGTKFVPLDG